MDRKEILYYLWRIIKWRLNNKSPIFASIKLTYRCNLKCIHCGWRELPQIEEISLKKWLSIFNELYNIGVRVLVLEGGEPTLYNELAKLIIEAKKMKFKIILITNCINSLENYEPDLTVVSVDGNKEQHEIIRGPHSYDKLLKNIHTIKTKKISLTTLNKLNYKNIEKIISSMKDIIDTFAFNIMYPCTETSLKFCLDKNEINNIYKRLRVLSKNFDIANTAPMLVEGNWKCYPWMMVLCEPNGIWKYQQECFIDYINEIHDCSNCHLACYKGFSQLAMGDINAWYLVNKFLFEK